MNSTKTKCLQLKKHDQPYQTGCIVKSTLSSSYMKKNYQIPIPSIYQDTPFLHCQCFPCPLSTMRHLRVTKAISV